ncbi:hypothetical protein F5Y18DRAFT_133871 [Xylariaceae sp. FL1019]|nr:hypothetical protein F5Y18DRAFT_133871 [Xylariaceae sp. FL1019]
MSLATSATEMSLTTSAMATCTADLLIALAREEAVNFQIKFFGSIMLLLVASWICLASFFLWHFVQPVKGTLSLFANRHRATEEEIELDDLTMPTPPRPAAAPPLATPPRVQVTSPTVTPRSSHQGEERPHTPQWWENY